VPKTKPISLQVLKRNFSFGNSPFVKNKARETHPMQTQSKPCATQHATRTAQAHKADNQIVYFLFCLRKIIFHFLINVYLIERLKNQGIYYTLHTC